MTTTATAVRRASHAWYRTRTGTGPARDHRSRRLVVRGAAALLGLMAQSVLAGPPVGWRMDGSGDFPLADPPTQWSTTRNVLWATQMPSWSNASPVLIGDRLFVTSEPDLLVSLSADDGRIVWQRSSSLDVLLGGPPESKFSPRRSTEIEEARSALERADLALTEARRHAARAPADGAAVRWADDLARENDSLRRRLAETSATSPPQPSDSNGLATPTPTTDGESVYVLFGTGVVGRYDLDGRRRWIQLVDRPQDRDGIAASPVLAGDDVVVLVNDLVALDRATGAFRWRTAVPPRSGTPAVFEIEHRAFVITPSGHCVRVADGSIVASNLGDVEHSSPVIRDGVLYMVQHSAHAFRIPDRLGEPLVFEPMWTARMKGERFYASPLIAGGLLYGISRGQILSVLDATTGEFVYGQRLRLGWTGAADSVFTSPARAGGHVFVSGLSGTTAVLKLGRRFEQVASNELEMLRSSPTFDGRRMYVRGLTKTYCIANPRQREAQQPADGASP